MLSEAISLRRLRFYESECRRGAASASDVVAKTELCKLEESFGRAARELQMVYETLFNEAR
jgi:hypothetical protein